MRKVEFVVELDKLGNDRMRVKIVTEKGELLEIVYQYESFVKNKWYEIVRYDCTHGFFHRDIIWPNGKKEKQEIIIDNLKTASKYAEQDIKDRWEWYKTRFVKKLKRK